MIHQPLGGAQGQVSDLEIQTREAVQHKQRLTEILAKHTGQDFDKLVVDTDRNFFMSADEAKDYGIVDEVYNLDKK
jgi:ATP-dependent Clp protease protease subunit